MIPETLKIVNINNNIPNYATEGSAGIDLYVDLKHNPINFIKGEGYEWTTLDEDIMILLKPHGRVLLPTGVFIELPANHVADIRPRSGLAINKGLVCNYGTIDEDYRGELGIIFFNTSEDVIIIGHGMKAAQLVIHKYERLNIRIVDKLTDTQRGDKGFGSTGS